VENAYNYKLESVVESTAARMAIRYMLYGERTATARAIV